MKIKKNIKNNNKKYLPCQNSPTLPFFRAQKVCQNSQEFFRNKFRP